VNYYTYAHSSPKGDVFYIGKGKEDRAFTRHDRSYLWRKRILKERGIHIQILADWETEEEAYQHELFLIACFKDMGANLVNKTDGGKGPTNFMQSPEVVRQRALKLTGFKHKILSCPHCGQIGGQTSLKRWHFDNCTGKKATFKARVTVDGKRLYLRKYQTKEEATKVMIEYYKSIDKALPTTFISRRGTP
jgi:hypothetical protein